MTSPHSADLREAILARLPYTPNEQQAAVIDAFARFFAPDAPQWSAFILNGYAGTGKTTLVGALVQAYESLGGKTVLLAPTGRAAKVFSAGAASHPASTIHRKIYRHKSNAAGEYSAPAPADNRHVDTIFIVDEASMIGASREGSLSLLDDLVEYVYAGPGCRLFLLGDTAQLPPVGEECSPAMRADRLRAYGLKVTAATLTRTVRQSAGSGILYNATVLRRAMTKAIKAVREGATAPFPHLRTSGFTDVRTVLPEDLPELLEAAYSQGGPDSTVMITRSNKRAAAYNMAIRANVLYREEELSRGDVLIIARNHYFHSRKTGEPDFVANGESATVLKIYGSEQRYGMRFADVRIRTSEDIEIDTKIVLDTLAADTAVLPQETRAALYQQLIAQFEADGNGDFRTDPYWNALEVKYAYAVTCHKAQGGQWDNVFVDLSYIPEDALGLTLYRWLYTAVTRAKTNLYLIAPPEAIMEDLPKS